MLHKFLFFDLVLLTNVLKCCSASSVRYKLHMSNYVLDLWWVWRFIYVSEFLFRCFEGSFFACFSLKGDCSEVYLLDPGVLSVMKSSCVSLLFYCLSTCRSDVYMCSSRICIQCFKGLSLLLLLSARFSSSHLWGSLAYVCLVSYSSSAARLVNGYSFHTKKIILS